MGGERIKALVLLLFLFPLPYDRRHKEEGAEKEEEKQIASFAGTFLPPHKGPALIVAAQRSLTLLEKNTTLLVLGGCFAEGSKKMRLRKKSCFAGDITKRSEFLSLPLAKQLPPNTVLGGKGASLGEGPFLRVKYKKSEEVDANKGGFAPHRRAPSFGYASSAKFWKGRKQAYTYLC